MTRFQAWKTAARVHTLPAAIVPVLVGTGLAYGEGVFRWDVFVCALIGAVAIQVAANFALIQPALTDAPAILTEVVKLIGGDVPTIEQLQGPPRRGRD